jgi:hypothetical protein
MPTFLEFIRKLRLPTCSICNKTVETETATSDDDGKAVHEECWLFNMRLEQARKPPRV